MWTKANRHVSTVCLATVLLGIAAWLSWAPAQYYMGGGGSRKSVSLRSELTVGQGPSTINTMNIRAYSFGMDDMPRSRFSSDPPGGVLSSSIYTGSSLAVQRPGGSSAANQPTYGFGPTMTPGGGRGVAQPPIIVPVQPLRMTTGGAMLASPVMVAPLMTATTTMRATPATTADAQPDRPGYLPTGRITSLVPKVTYEYQEPMAKGEAAFRRGDYAEAKVQFEKARQLSRNSPESLLALTHTALATATDSYEDTARYLAATIVKFPYLPLVDVNPRDFFSSPDVYDRIKDRLEKAVKANPSDGSAMLVLGYLNMRDNLFPLAGKNLKDAAKVTTNREQTYAIDVLLKFMNEVRQDIIEKAPDLAPPSVLASAGMKLALPVGFALKPVSDPNQFLAALRDGGDSGKPQMINAFAYPVDKEVTPRVMLDQLASMISSNLAVAKLSQLEEMEVPYLQTTAVARLYQLEFMEMPIITVRLCFAREVPAPDGKGPPQRMMYVLAMAVSDSEVESLLPTFSTVARSVSLVDLKRPAELLPSVKCDEIQLPEFGYAVGKPQGWTGQRTERGYALAVTDYLDGGIACPQADFVTALVPESLDSKAFGEKVIRDRIAEGQRITVLSDRNAQLAGRDGHEFLLRRSAAVAATSQPAATTSSPAEPAEFMELARLICVPAAEGKMRVYALMVRGQTADEATLRTTMDVLAGNFRLLTP